MLDRLNALYPVRYTVLLLCIGLSLLSLFILVATGNGAAVCVLSTALTVFGFLSANSAVKPQTFSG